MAKKIKHNPRWTTPMKESSQVLAHAHDTARSIMYIRFKSGAEWAYENIDEAMYLKFINAESIGSFLNKEIKSLPNVFKASKI